mgnify:FL=1
MNDYQKIVESDIQTFIDNYDTRPVDLDTKNYERNIVFLGCSLTFGLGVDNKDTYPSRIQQLSNDKWNCINLGICGGSIDMAYLIFNKVKNLNIDDIVIQWPSFYRRAYFENKNYKPYLPTQTLDDMELSDDFANISDNDYCLMRNLSNLQVINSFKSVYNLSPNIGHDYKDLFEKYDIENILDFNFYLDTEDKYRIEDGHPNELWYEQYSEYLYKELK